MKQRILCAAVAAAMAFSAAGCSGSSSSSASSQTLSAGDYTGTVSAISESSITLSTDAKGGAGVFAYGDGVTTVSDSTITTTQDTSGGIHVAGDGGTLTGAFVDDESNAGTGGSGYASLTVEGGSAWVVTGNSVLTDLANAGQIVDSQGRTVTIQSADGTIYVQGTSDVTVTVSSYTTQIDTTGTSTADSWSSYAAA